MQKPYNWRTDYDWTDPNDEPVDETIIDETELMLPKDAKGIKSLDMPGNDKVADLDAMKDGFSELIFGKPIDELSPAEFDELEILFEMEYGKKDGGRIGYAFGPDDPGIVEDDLSTIEFMQDQGVPYGEQASGIDPNINIEVVVEEFIKRKGRKPRSIEEIKEFYFQEMAGGSRGPQRVAYNPGDYDPMIVDEYEKYKGEQEDIGGPVITIDEFLMQQRAGARAGGLPGILGV